MSTVLRSVDCCTGAGGLALGLHRAGFTHEALLEIDKAACRTLSLNAKLLGIAGAEIPTTDIKTKTFDTFANIDLLSAGVPCQPFSMAGKHLGHVDDRNLFPVVIRAAREMAPRAVLIENVYALLRPRFADFFEYVQRQLRTPEITRRSHERWTQHLARLRERQQKLHHYAGLKYRVGWAVLQAADFGVPQLRSRVFVVAYRDDVDATWVSPAEDPHAIVKTHSRDSLLHAQWITGEYWREHGLRQPAIPPEVRPWIKKHTEEKPPAAPRWRTVRDALVGLDEPSSNATDDNDHVRQAGARRYKGHDGSQLDSPAKTIKAGVHGVAGGENMLRHTNGRVRYFTVREAARLQTFDDAFTFGGCRWGVGLRQIGNAVPVEFGHVVGAQIASTLRSAVARPRARRAA